MNSKKLRFYITLYNKFRFSVLNVEWGVNIDHVRINRYDSKHDLMISLHKFKQDIKQSFDETSIRSDVLEAILRYVSIHLNPFLIRWHPLFFTPHGRPIYRKIKEKEIKFMAEDLVKLRDQHAVIVKMLDHFIDLIEDSSP